MSKFFVSRRQWIGLLGVGALVLPAGVARAGSRSSRRRSSQGQAPEQSVHSPLLAPLVSGMMLGSLTIESISPVQEGALTVGLRDGAGQRFFVDICKRDTGLGAPSAPAHTDRYELFVVNEGDGNQPTSEDQGRAALALAEILRTNEHAVQVEGMLTLRDRLSRFADSVGRAYIPT